MMMMFHLAYALYLLSFAAGLALLIWGLRAEGSGRVIGKVFGTIIIILSLMGAFLLGYHGIKYWPGQMHDMMLLNQEYHYDRND